MTIIPIGPYRPDAPVSTPNVSFDVVNMSIILDPEVGVAYGPLPDILALSGSTALPADFKGALSAVTKAGVYILFVMTASTIYRVGSTGSLTSLGTGYNLPAGDRWSSTQIGTKAIFTNKNDGLLQYDIELGGAITAIPNAPKARFIRKVFDLLFAGDCDGDNKLLRNSDFDYTNWTGGVANFQPLTDSTEIVGIEEVSDGQALLFQRDTIHILNRVEDARIYTMDVLIRNDGPGGPWNIVPYGGAVYYVGSNGVRRVSPTGLETIGAGKIDRSIIQVLDKDKLATMEGAYDPENHRIRWRFIDFPTAASNAGSSSSAIDYDINANEFVPVSIATSGLFVAASPGYTTEDLDAFGTMDTITLSLDDRFWYGGLPQMAGLDTNGKFGFFSGDSLFAGAKTAAMVFQQRMLVSSITPITDAIAGSYRVLIAERAGDAFGSSAISSMQPSGRVPVRGAGKKIALGAAMLAGDDWTYIRGFDDVVMMPQGPR